MMQVQLSSNPTGTLVLPDCEPFASRALTISKPSTTWPNTTCLPSSLKAEKEGYGFRKKNSQIEKQSIMRLAIPLGLDSAEEELTSVGVRASVGHGQNA
jgi:hypothetical protein